MAYDYDESRSAGPRGETRPRARERLCRALTRSQITAAGREPTMIDAHACCRSNRRETTKPNRPWLPYEDVAYGDGGGHGHVVLTSGPSAMQTYRRFLSQKIQVINK